MTVQTKVGRRRWKAPGEVLNRYKGVVVVFAGTRTRLDEIDVQAGSSDVERDHKHNVVILRWDPKPPDANVDFEIATNYVGDVPLIARVAWISDDADDDPVPLLPGWIEPPSDLPSELQYLWELEVSRRAVHVQTIPEQHVVALASTAATTPADLFAERRKALEVDRRVRAFFQELDERTHPAMVAQATWDTIDRVSGMLFNRIEIRADVGKASQSPVFTQPGGPYPAQEVADLQVVSTLFQQVHAAHLVLPAPADLMSWAFEQFSLDCATVFHHDTLWHDRLQSHGAPDGSEYFKFIELAFACIDHEVDTAFWKVHVLALVRAAHSFVERADAPAPGAATMSTATALSYQPGRFLSTQRRRELREEYDLLLQGKSTETAVDILSQRFTSMLAQVLFDTNAGATLLHAKPALTHPAVIVRAAGAPLVS
jgi:hypothetical protein